MARQPPPSHCALCGAEIPPGARACPDCGADERTGWREQDPADGLDLPDPEDTAEAHARFLREMEPRQGRDRFKHAVLLAIATVLVIVFLAGMFLAR